MSDPSTITAVQLLNLVYGDNSSYLPSQLERGLSALTALNQELLPTAQRLLTTGPDVARSMVRSHLSDCIDDAVYMLDYHGGEEFEPDPDTVFQLRQFWSCGTVIHEIGMTSKSQREDASLGLTTLGLGESRELFEHEWYWRGVAALAITEMWINEGSINHELDFIEYAGKHRDIGAVIIVCKDRLSTNIRMINAVLSQSAHTPMLRSGSL